MQTNEQDTAWQADASSQLHVHNGDFMLKEPDTEC